MAVLWTLLLVAGVASLIAGIALWVRNSNRTAAQYNERYGPPSAPAYFLAVGGVMAAGIGGVMLALQSY